jgi:predicted phosphoribosyltransferase
MQELHYFQDRKEAGRRLAAALMRKGYQDPIVLGIPRGGVAVAAEVAEALGAELGVVVARKLGAPDQPELAIGAVTSDGVSYIDYDLAERVGADQAYLNSETKAKAEEARRREEAFDSHRRPHVKGRTVIVVDDGIATGATAVAALRSIRAEGAERVVLAVPVGPPQRIDELRREADEIVCLLQEPSLLAVGQFYIDFHPLDDGEVKAVLDAQAVRLAGTQKRAGETE